MVPVKMQLKPFVADYTGWIVKAVSLKIFQNSRSNDLINHLTYEINPNFQIWSWKAKYSNFKSNLIAP